MNRPALLIVPPELFQITLVLVVPETVAANCWLAPLAMVTDAGETLTLILGSAWTTLM